MADPVDLWSDKTSAPGIPLDLNFIALLVLAGFAILLTGVIAHEIWTKFRRRRRRHSRNVERGHPDRLRGKAPLPPPPPDTRSG